MRGLLFLMMLFFGLDSFSQKLDFARKVEVLKEINSLKIWNDYEEIMDSCNKYLVEAECDWFRKELFKLKTQCLYEAGKSVFDEEMGDHQYDHLLDSLIWEIDSIIGSEKVKCVGDTMIYNRMRYEYNGVYGIIYPELNNSKNPFFEGVSSFAIAPQFYYGNNQWIGVEVFLGFLQRKNKMQYIDSEPMFSLNLLGVGFRKNISSKRGWGVNLSLLSFSSNWINVRPINLTYLNNGERGTLGYSPELGLQFWYLHLNAGYNLAFKKSMRNYEKLYFAAKFDIPFYRF